MRHVERTVMDALWERGDGNVHAVLRRLGLANGATGYSSRSPFTGSMLTAFCARRQFANSTRQG
jgi:hypothetical protein